jgi:hypothetical protein
MIGFLVSKVVLRLGFADSSSTTAAAVERQRRLLDDSGCVNNTRVFDRVNGERGGDCCCVMVASRLLLESLRRVDANRIDLPVEFIMVLCSFFLFL